MAGGDRACHARITENIRQLRELVAGHEIPEEISEIIRHLATAEQWYLLNIDLVPDGKRPDNPLERFAWIRAFTLRALPTLADLDMVADCSEEGWTPRKVLRRTIWHERDHTQQIAPILSASI